MAHTADGTYQAYSMICAHPGTTIRINSTGFLCPNHGAAFDVNGAWVQSRKRTNALTRMPLLYDATAETSKLG